MNFTLLGHFIRFVAYFLISWDRISISGVLNLKGPIVDHSHNLGQEGYGLSEVEGQVNINVSAEDPDIVLDHHVTRILRLVCTCRMG